ncbi:MotA/TolQ/ExbB proton channel family protein [Methylomonas paludis]|uniref:MotA/TolQ/ExbB proton channel family protein n=1 Tax=Methylomonas paludis TaxID=1173101 RepID=A0A975RAM2_9GAMM|nr:MotA/TolQ/ExbB proton channel family protein [Methylomonas paludis]QWF71493.1 MotA/TolQ/ExbB proton channel family protein [Methylomonas paludis]
MFEVLKNGGWMMIPIIICSIVSMAIIGERLWFLQRKRIIPAELVAYIWQLHRDNQLDDGAIRRIKHSSLLGKILAAGLQNRKYGREMMKTSLEEVGRQVTHELERYLNALGSIASITPLLGLLGTVDGIIRVFSDIAASGLGDPVVLSRGISEALICTASGLTVAIPSLFFHRYFERLVDDRVVRMEEEALRLIDFMQGDREDT